MDDLIQLTIRGYLSAVKAWKVQTSASDRATARCYSVLMHRHSCPLKKVTAKTGQYFVQVEETTYRAYVKNTVVG